MNRLRNAAATVMAASLTVACGPRSLGSLGKTEPSTDAGQRTSDGAEAHDMAALWDVARDAPMNDTPPGAKDATMMDVLTAVEASAGDRSFLPELWAADRPLPSIFDVPVADVPLAAEVGPLDLAWVEGPLVADAEPLDLARIDRPLVADAESLDLARADGPLVAEREPLAWIDGPLVADAEPVNIASVKDALGADRPLAVDAAPVAVDSAADSSCGYHAYRPEVLVGWEPVPSASEARITTIARAKDGSPFWVGFTNGDVYMGDGSGSNPYWTKVDDVRFPSAPSLPNLAVSALVVSPQDGQSIWAAFFGAPEGFGHKVWHTSMAGQSWTELIKSPGESIWSLSLNPLDSRFLYLVTTGNDAPGTDAGVTANLYRSADSGETWSWWIPDGNDLHTNGSNLTAIAFDSGDDPSRGMRIWTGDRAGGIWVSNRPDPSRGDSVRTWAMAGGGTPERTVNHLSIVVDSTGEHLAAAFRSWAADGVWLSDDGGSTWRNGHGACLPSLAVIYSVTIHPLVSSTLYAFTSAGAFRSDDGGATWW
jgi:hypothetical protein